MTVVPAASIGIKQLDAGLIDCTVNCATGYSATSNRGNGPVNNVLPSWDFCYAYRAAFAMAAAAAPGKTGKGSQLRIALRS